MWKLNKMLSEYILIGEVLKPSGIKGAVKIRPYTGDPERFRLLDAVYVSRSDGMVCEPFRLLRLSGSMVYALLGASHSVNTAEAYRGVQLFVDRARAVELGPDENFICDMIGCEAFDETNTWVGVLTDVLSRNPVDIYVFSTDTGTFMAPALKSVFLSVDTALGRISVNAEKLGEVAVFAD